MYNKEIDYQYCHVINDDELETHITNGWEKIEPNDDRFPLKLRRNVKQSVSVKVKNELTFSFKIAGISKVNQLL